MRTSSPPAFWTSLGEKHREMCAGRFESICTVTFKGGDSGGLRCGGVWGWREAGSECLSWYHMHVPPDSYSTMSHDDSCRKSLVSSQPHFSSGWFLSPLYSWYLPPSLSFFLHVPAVFAVSLPSLLHPSLCFYDLTMGVSSMNWRMVGRRIIRFESMCETLSPARENRIN